MTEIKRVDGFQTSDGRFFEKDKILLADAHQAMIDADVSLDTRMSSIKTDIFQALSGISTEELEGNEFLPDIFINQDTFLESLMENYEKILTILFANVDTLRMKYPREYRR